MADTRVLKIYIIVKIRQTPVSYIPYVLCFTYKTLQSPSLMEATNGKLFTEVLVYTQLYIPLVIFSPPPLTIHACACRYHAVASTNEYSFYLEYKIYIYIDTGNCIFF